MSEDIRKWSDGRYTLMFDEHTFFVFDNEKEKRMTALNVTEKLNEQQSTNDYLEESNSRLQVQLGETLRLVDKLKEENEQLKKQNIEYEEVQCKIMNYIIDKGLGSEFAKFLREAENE